VEKEDIAFLMPHGCNFDDPLRHIDIIEDPKRLNTELPFRQGIGTSPFPMARLVRWLMEELSFDGHNNVLLIVLAKLTKIVNGFWREDNAKHRRPRMQHD
jgi:hypothetical protein